MDKLLKYNSLSINLQTFLTCMNFLVIFPRFSFKNLMQKSRRKSFKSYTKVAKSDRLFFFSNENNDI